MQLVELREFFDPPITISWDLAPEQALEYLRAKGLRRSFSFADLTAEERRSAFTIAKMLDMDLLADVQASLTAAMAAGTPFRQWAQSITPMLQAKGWWGKQPVVDPATGQTVTAQLGSAHRLQTIFRTNMQSAYAAGEWQQITEQAELAPYLMYDAVDDFRTRPEHAALDGKIRPADDAFWRHYYPPNGWNCRCGVIQLSADEVEEMGLQVSPPEKIRTYEWTNPRTGKVERIPVGVDPGFDFNPGERRQQGLMDLATQKAKALPSDLRAAAAKKLAATEPAVQPTTATTTILAASAVTFTPQAAHAAILDALGPSAASMDVPPGANRSAFRDLPLEHQRAIVAYTGSYYAIVNPSLRDGIASEPVQRYARLLNEALALSPKYTGMATRAITLHGADLERFLKDHQAASLTGAVITHHGFVSASKGDKAIFPGNVILHIESRAGVDVESIAMRPEEREVLLSHETAFLVRKIEQVNMQWHVHLEEVNVGQH